MNRCDKRIVRRMVVALAVSFGSLWAAGALFLWMYPPTEVEQKCVGKSLAELGQCMYDNRSK